MQDDDEVILANAELDVPADNYEEFDQEIDPEKFGAQLIQTNTLKGTRREYQSYADRYLLLNFVEKKTCERKKLSR